MSKNIVAIVALLVSFASTGFAYYAWNQGNQQYYEENRPFVFVSNANPDLDTESIRKFLIMRNYGSGPARVKWVQLLTYDPHGHGVPFMKLNEIVTEGLRDLYAEDPVFVERVQRELDKDAFNALGALQDEPRVVNASFNKSSTSEVVLAPGEHEYFHAISRELVDKIGFLRVINAFTGIQLDVCYCNVSEQQCWLHTERLPAGGGDEAAKACPGQLVGCGARQETPVLQCGDGPDALTR